VSIVVGSHLSCGLAHLSPLFVCCFRLDRRHPKDVFDVFWPRLANLFARCHGHTASGEAVNVFTEVVPHARHRTVTVPASAPESAPSPSPSLLERRLAGRPDLDLGALRHLRDSLTLAIPSRQVSDPGSVSSSSPLQMVIWWLGFWLLVRWLTPVFVVVTTKSALSLP
jgi:hypothetical protein